MKWAVLVLAAALAVMCGAMWYQVQQINAAHAEIAQLRSDKEALQSSLSAMQEALNVQLQGYAQADKQSQDRLNLLDQMAGDWGTMCLPDGLGGLFCTSSEGADRSAASKSDAGNAGSRLDPSDK